MKTRMKIALGTAVASALGLMPVVYAVPSAPAPAAGGDAQAKVPVREVVLFSSGVGYFEHFGQISGNSTTVLHFKTEQVNDILKSLVLQDLDKGQVAAVTYPSQGPLEHTLKSFQLDLTANPSLADLLNQLRGANVSITLVQGARQVQGTVLGVEKQQRPSGDKDHPNVEVAVVNLVSDAGIVPLELSQVGDVKIQDPELQRELGQALAALAQARDKDKKPVEIHFAGQGERRVRIGYVVETPVWKTSYRLILPSEQDKAAKGQEQDQSKQDQNKSDQPKLDSFSQDPAPPPGKDPHPGQGGAAGGGGQGSLQGWAIVENQTDSDWKDVQLSLVSGRPISFIEDLYQPLYIPRPVVQPELYASLRPQTYEGGLEEKQKAVQLQVQQAEAGEPMDGLKREGALGRRAAKGAAMDAAAAAPAPMGAGMDPGYRERFAAIDPTASISSIASAAKVGELFQYTVGNVSIARQQSAMLPIVTDAVQVDKLSIYNPAVLPNNPLLGARLKNTTGKYLLQGPITVLAGGSYAGDAKIQDLPPGQERLISYGVDQQVLVHASDNTQSNQLLGGKIVKGVLQLTSRQTFSQQYNAEDKADTPRTLLIEAPRHPGWTLLEPAKPIETTDSLYRFQGKLQPHQPATVTVKEQRTDLQQIAILPMDGGALLTYSRTGEISQPVKDALARAAQLKAALSDSQRQTQEKQQKINDITTEQARIRENMKAVSPVSDYAKRLLAELDEQETQIQDLHKQVQSLQKDQDQKRKDLEDYLGNLSVE